MMKGDARESLQTTMLAGEEVHLVLGSKGGVTKSAPAGEDYLVLTSRRIIAAWREETRRRQVAAPLDRVDGVELAELSRELKPLVTGGLFMLAGVMVPWVAALLNLNSIVAWLLAAVLLVLGAVTASAYFVRDQAAIITFRAGALEASLPLRSAQAVRGAYTAASLFFSLAAAKGAPYSLESPPGEPFRWTRDQAKESGEVATLI
jgi:hypothetical protein